MQPIKEGHTMKDKTAHRVQLDITLNMMASSNDPIDRALAKHLTNAANQFDWSYKSMAVYLNELSENQASASDRGNTSFTQAIDDSGLIPLGGQNAPIDPSNRVLVSGKPVPDDYSHTKLKENGQQQDYIVLSKEEIEKGFVRPVRRKYIHAGINPTFQEYQENHFEVIKPGEGGCGVLTIISLSIAETYAAKPDFYEGTFCCGCNKHFPLEHFVWEGTNQIVGS